MVAIQAYPSVMTILLTCIILGMALGVWFWLKPASRQGNSAHQNHARSQVARQLLTELTENKNKAEAFISIYQDLLQKLRLEAVDTPLNNTENFVHSHVPLNRDTYDQITTDLPLLGGDLVRELQQLYAHISPASSYQELGKDTAHGHALQLVEGLIDDASELVIKIDGLIQPLRMIERDGVRKG